MHHLHSLLTRAERSVPGHWAIQRGDPGRSLAFLRDMAGIEIHLFLTARAGGKVQSAWHTL